LDARRRSISADQARLSANRSYDTAKENRLRLLGSRLIPTYSDTYYKNTVEDKINELIKKELTKETTSVSPKTDSEMIKLVKTLIKKTTPKKKSVKKPKKKSVKKPKKKSVKKPKKKSVKKPKKNTNSTKKPKKKTNSTKKPKKKTNSTKKPKR
jgi:outer membrane biosynthesis protein TonB